MNLSDLRSKLSKNAAFRRAYDEIGDAISLGVHFRAARLAAKLTQSQLASVLQLRAADISQLEAGSPKVPDWIWAEVAKRLDEHLTARGVDVGPLLAMEGRPVPEQRTPPEKRPEVKIAPRNGKILSGRHLGADRNVRKTNTPVETDI